MSRSSVCLSMQDESSPIALVSASPLAPTVAATQTLLTQWLPAVGDAVRSTGAQEHRSRKLPAILVLLLMIAHHLWPTVGQRPTLGHLVDGWRETDHRWQAWTMPTTGAIAQARERLGVRPLVALFHTLAHPLATPATPGAFYAGLRLMAMDGTNLTLPDTAANHHAFGVAHNQHGEAAYPSLRVVWLAEIATRLLCNVVIRPATAHEIPPARVLLRNVSAGLLILWDRGFHAYDLIAQVCAAGSQVLERISYRLVFPVEQVLADGSYRSTLYPDRRHPDPAQAIPVRIIDYTIEDPENPGHHQRYRLLTTLLDPDLAPAEELAVVYHQRWEIETLTGEVKIRQCLPTTTLTSQRPDLAVQEAYGVFLAHRVVRTLMAAAAQAVGVAPTDLSFTGALHVVQRAVSRAQRRAAEDPPFLSPGC